MANGNGKTQVRAGEAPVSPELQKQRDYVKQMSTDLQRQRDYVKEKQAEGFDFGLVVADAFVRGIRDIGYRHTGTALDELIDNAIQAGAENIHVVFGFDQPSAKPSRIAVVDDGHGMDPDMIRLAVVWGGTHRENDRNGFGRYGYGLPSAAVSQGRRFEVYSVPEGGTIHKVALDLDEIKAGKYTNKNGEIVVPEPRLAIVPMWVAQYLKAHGKGGSFRRGTVVVIDKVDRLTWKTVEGLESNLLQHFGVTYRNYLRQLNLFVNGEPVAPVDPLFLTPGFRHYDIDADRAVPLEPLSIEVKDADSRAPLGTIKVRYAYLPVTFATMPEHKSRGDARNTKKNARLSIMKDYNGIIVLRNGRQIDVVNPEWTVFQNNDRYVKVEVDFPATLDEEFSITTSKQQITISKRIWDLLKQHGVLKAIENMRARFKQDRSQLVVQQDQVSPDQKRPSELAMEDAGKFIRRPPETQEKLAKADERLQVEVNRRAQETRRPPEEVQLELKMEVQGHPYKVVTEQTPGAPFFRVEQIGGQKVLYLNTAHRFYTDVYTAEGSTPQLRAALEVLLFVIGDCELDAKEDIQTFYQAERATWSLRLTTVLDRLEQFVAAASKAQVEDEPAAMNEEAEVTVASSSPAG